MPIVAAILLRQIPSHVGIRRTLLTIHFHRFSNVTPDARVRGIARRFATSLDKYITQLQRPRLPPAEWRCCEIEFEFRNRPAFVHICIYIYIYIVFGFFRFKTYSQRVGATVYTCAFYSFTSCGFMPPMSTLWTMPFGNIWSDRDFAFAFALNLVNNIWDSHN